MVAGRWFLLNCSPPAAMVASKGLMLVHGFSISGAFGMTNGRTYSEMLEAARRKLNEAQFFHRRLFSERDGRLFESEPGAFSYYLSAFLSAGESVRYVLLNADKKKCTEWFDGFADDTDRELLEFMNIQRGEEIHGEGANTTAKLEPVPAIVLIRANQTAGGHPAYGMHIFGPPGSQVHPMRSVLYFTGDEEDLIDKCAKYLRLLEGLVQEFIQGS